MRRSSVLGCCTILLGACSSSPATTGAGGHGGTSSSSATTSSSGSSGSSGGAGATSSSSTTSSSTTSSSTTSGTGGHGGEPSPPDAGADGGDAGGPTGDTLQDNRDRLLGTYYDYLKANATQPQSNGLSGSNVSSVCDLWSKLDPSPRDVFLTLTARLQGSILGDDGSSMLSHVTRIYRIAGGQGETATSPGSCGGGEYNRMIMSMDAHLQKSQLAANQHQGAVQPNGKYDIGDIPSTSYWRNSHDLGGPHAPFDLSDETNQGAPRGQTQYFSDPTSALANMPLNRMDLTTLVDPYALEMDQDYDCVHNSNPDCSYITYGPLCLPETNEPGTAVYTMSYGSYDPGYAPAGCGP
jgi:hypothetical protein